MRSLRREEAARGRPTPRSRMRIRRWLWPRWMEPPTRFLRSHRQRAVRVARFVRKADGSADRSADGALDGEVHGLYTIAGRKDAKGCVLKQPDFARQMAENNVVFRIPTPLSGWGWSRTLRMRRCGPTWTLRMRRGRSSASAALSISAAAMARSCVLAGRP